MRADSSDRPGTWLALKAKSAIEVQPRETKRALISSRPTALTRSKKKALLSRAPAILMEVRRRERERGTR